MRHLDEGTLQAFLDDELTGAERAAVAEHMLGCEECRGAYDELRFANALFSEAVSLLDAEAKPLPSAPAVGRRRFPRFGAVSVAKAAGLVLVLAAAASAAVPGSPVRVWVERAIQRDDSGEAPAGRGLKPAAVVPHPVGLAIVPRAATLEVTVEHLEGATIRLRESGADAASVSAIGARRDPMFESGRDRIGVRGGEGGELLVELPESLPSARLVVDGRVYAELSGGQLRALVPAQRERGEMVWR